MSISKSDSEANEIKTVLKSLLIAISQTPTTIEELEQIYFEEECTHIPYRKLGFNSFLSYLQSIPDCVHLEKSNNTYIARHVDSEKSKHISSLVARQRPPAEKKSHRHKKYKRYSAHNHNHNYGNHNYEKRIPNETFNRFLQLAKRTSEGVSKEYLVNIINKNIPGFSFTMDDLNRHLCQVPPEYFVTDDKIFYKYANSNFQTTKETNKELRRLSSSSTLNSSDNYYSSRENSTIHRTQNVSNLDFNTSAFGVQNFINDSRFSLPDYSNETTDIFSSKLQDLNCIKQNIFLDDNPSKIDQSFIPHYVMGLDVSIKRINVVDLNRKPGQYEEVSVSEIFNPSIFWVQLVKYKSALKNLMTNLHQFYSNIDLEEYKIPRIPLKAGLNVACLYSNKWHRAVIEEIKPKEELLILSLCDYGTMMTYHLSELYFLHNKFSTLPAQSILCSLARIKPYKACDWSERSVSTFKSFVTNKDLVASISTINVDKNSIKIDLFDTNTNDDINIGEYLMQRQFAEPGSLIRNEIDNIPYDHYVKCLKDDYITAKAQSISTIPSKKIILKKLLENKKAKDLLTNSNENKTPSLKLNNDLPAKQSEGQAPPRRSLRLLSVAKEVLLAERTATKKSNSFDTSELYADKSTEVKSDKFDKVQGSTCSLHLKKPLILEIPETGSFRSPDGGRGRMEPIDWSTILDPPESETASIKKMATKNIHQNSSSLNVKNVVPKSCTSQSVSESTTVPNVKVGRNIDRLKRFLKKDVTADNTECLSDLSKSDSQTKSKIIHDCLDNTSVAIALEREKKEEKKIVIKEDLFNLSNFENLFKHKADISESSSVLKNSPKLNAISSNLNSNELSNSNESLSINPESLIKKVADQFFSTSKSRNTSNIGGNCPVFNDINVQSDDEQWDFSGFKDIPQYKKTLPKSTSLKLPSTSEKSSDMKTVIKECDNLRITDSPQKPQSNEQQVHSSSSILTKIKLKMKEADKCSNDQRCSASTN